MTKEEFLKLQKLIEQKMIELEELQAQHVLETGRRYIPPIRL